MTRWLAPLVILCTASCGATRIDASGYDTSCVEDADCMLVSFDDVCAGCATVPISSSEQTRAEAEMEAALGSCLFGQDECLQTQQAACVDGGCAAVPLGSGGQ